MSNLDFNLSVLKIGKGNHELTIKGIKFQLADHETVVALIGESGLGKTTIYKSLFSTYVNLWRKENPIEFKCSHQIKGKELTDDIIIKGKDKPNFGFATQVPYFYSYKSVEENLFYPLKWLKNIEDTNDFRNKYLEKFQLTDLRNAEMHHLSGGERQMINIARIFLSNPELVIFDETFSNMNEEKAKAYFELIKNNYPDTIIFLTSHRGTDIEQFHAKRIQLERKNDETNTPYVTIKL
jgi:ABC-type multidrug transport system ATPase subunit